MKRKDIINYINRQLGNWAKGHSVECHLNQKNWDGESTTLAVMRKTAKSGETWFIDRYHWQKCYKDNDDMIEITIP